jgi:hypothetical protein
MFQVKNKLRDIALAGFEVNDSDPMASVIRDTGYLN